MLTLPDFVLEGLAARGWQVFRPDRRLIWLLTSGGIEGAIWHCSCYGWSWNPVFIHLELREIDSMFGQSCWLPQKWKCNLTVWESDERKTFANQAKSA